MSAGSCEGWTCAAGREVSPWTCPVFVLWSAHVGGAVSARGCAGWTCAAEPVVSRWTCPFFKPAWLPERRACPVFVLGNAHDGTMSAGGCGGWACAADRGGNGEETPHAGPDVMSGPACGSLLRRFVEHCRAGGLDAGVAALVPGDGLAGVGVHDGAGLADPARAAASG